MQIISGTTICEAIDMLNIKLKTDGYSVCKAAVIMVIRSVYGNAHILVNVCQE